MAFHKRSHVKIVLAAMLSLAPIAAANPASAQVQKGRTVKNPYTPVQKLFGAIHDGNIEVVKHLLNSGVSANSKFAGILALNSALMYENKGIIEALLAAHADPNLIDASETPPLFFAVPSPDIFEMLLKHGADPSVRQPHAKDRDDQERAGGRSLLMMAILMHQQRTIDLLLARNAEVNVSDDEGITPLMCAVLPTLPIDPSPFDNISVMRTLLKRGADPYKTDIHGGTVLIDAAHNLDNKAVALLLANKASIDHKDKAGNTALDEAVESTMDAEGERRKKGLLTIAALVNGGTKVDPKGDADVSTAETDPKDKDIADILMRAPLVH